MKVGNYLLAVAVGVMGAACSANDPLSGIIPGAGSGEGGDCLIVVMGNCVSGGPNTGLPNHSCTQVAPAGSVVTVAESGPVCQITDSLNPGLNTCDVLDAPLAVDGDYDSPARAQYVLGAVDPLLEAFVSLTVDLPDVVNAGQVAAFLVSYPGGMLDASLFRGLTVTTALAGVEQESETFDTLVDVDVLGLLADARKVVVGFPNTTPYDRLTLTVDALVATADVINAVDIYEACLNAVPSP